MTQVPSVGDIVVPNDGKEYVISQVDAEGERLWADQNTLSYFFEDLAKDPSTANRWLVLW
jgi:hypothetical protein